MDSLIAIDNILDVESIVSDYSLVIFDLDDTLYSEKDYVYSGYRVIANAYPEYPEIFNMLCSAFLAKEPAIDKVFNALEMKNEIAVALSIYRNHMPIISLYDNVEQMLQRIRKRAKLGLITDGRPEGQRAKIAALGLETLFDSIIITDELGGVEYRKPCDASFKIMLEAFSVDAPKAVYIGDNINKDFIAPDALGMRSIYFKNSDGLYS